MTYVDLDGVLADFNGWAVENIVNGDFPKLFLEHYKSCFRDLKPIDSGLELLKSLDDDYCILTAMPNHDEYIEYGLEQGLTESEVERRYDVMVNNKLNWVRKYIGEVPVIIVPSRHCKTEFAKGNTLIDDYIKNVEDWLKAGGNAIHFKQSK